MRGRLPKRVWATGLAIAVLSTAYRTQPPAPGSPQALLSAARAGPTPSLERTSMRWVMNAKGWEVSGVAGIVGSPDRVMFDFHEPWGTVGMRWVVDSQEIAVILPESRTHYVGARAGWAWGVITGDTEDLLKWTALAFGPIDLPETEPSEVIGLDGSVEVHWSTDPRQVSIGPEGHIRSIRWRSSDGQTVLTADYLAYDPGGRPIEVGMLLAPSGTTLRLSMDSWSPPDPQVSIPAPDDVIVGMQRRPLEEFGVGSLLDFVGVIDGFERLR